DDRARHRAALPACEEPGRGHRRADRARRPGRGSQQGPRHAHGAVAHQRRRGPAGRAAAGNAGGDAGDAAAAAAAGDRRPPASPERAAPRNPSPEVTTAMSNETNTIILDALVAGELTRADLVKTTGLPKKTLSSALSRLQLQRLVTKTKGYGGAYSRTSGAAV